MKKLILAIALASTSAIAADVPYDGIVKQERKVKAQAAATMVKIYGYRCDSISSFMPFILSAGYKISCNNYRYSYELEDKGGRWVVTVQ